MKLRAGLAALCATLSACAAPTHTVPSASALPQAATFDQVQACAYLDDVVAVSSRYGVFAGGALEDTKAEVLQRSAKLGATHLVWEPPMLSQGSTASRGKAYRCV